MMTAAKDQTEGMHVAIESRAAEALEATAAVMKESKAMIEVTRQTHARLERLEQQQQQQQQQQQPAPPSSPLQWDIGPWPFTTPVPRLSQDQQVLLNYTFVAGLAGLAVGLLFKSS
jgi:hypothetical protein